MLEPPLVFYIIMDPYPELFGKTSNWIFSPCASMAETNGQQIDIFLF